MKALRLQMEKRAARAIGEADALRFVRKNWERIWKKAQGRPFEEVALELWKTTEQRREDNESANR